LWVKAYIPETQLAFVKLNQAVAVTHDGSKQEYEGTISHIANISEFTPRNVQSPDERHNQVFGVKVLLKDAAGIFKSGMAASIRIPTAK
jgi:HlyD family secretion protein